MVVYNKGYTFALLDSHDLSLVKKIELSIDCAVGIRSSEEFFVLYSKSKIFVFNFITMNFEVFKNFTGSITVTILTSELCGFSAFYTRGD